MCSRDNLTFIAFGAETVVLAGAPHDENEEEMLKRAIAISLEEEELYFETGYN